MADISKLKLPDNNTYSIKDETARTYIGDLTALATTAKDNLVVAINEAAQVVTSLENYVKKSGDTMTGALTTTALTVGSKYSKDDEVEEYTATLGVGNTASGQGAVAMGYITKALGGWTVAEGGWNKASGQASHVCGENNAAGYAYQFVIGQFNDNQEDSVFEIGWGSTSGRKNIFRIDNRGNVFSNAQSMGVSPFDTTQTVNVTVSGTSDGCKNYKKDRTVYSYLRFKLKSSLANGSTLTLGTYVDKLKPFTKQFGFVYNDSCDMVGYCCLDTSGILTMKNKFGSSITTSTWLNATLCYFANVPDLT